MDDGPPRFAQDFSCPALLRIPSRCFRFILRGYHPLWRCFPDNFVYLLTDHYMGPTTSRQHVAGIWALSRSLVTTRKISFDFFSTRYLDISVPRVSFASLMNSARDIPTNRYGLPHSDISGSTVVCTFPKLIAACHVLHRLFAPMHPPYALSNLNYNFMKHRFCSDSRMKIVVFFILNNILNFPIVKELFPYSCECGISLKIYCLVDH